MLRKEKMFIAFLIAMTLSGAYAAAQVVGPQGIYDFLWVNGTNVNAGSLFLDGENVTETLTGNYSATDIITTGAVNASVLNFTSEFYYNDENRTDILAFPYLTSTMIIWLDGSTYKVKNGTTGQIDFQGTDGADMINWALGNMTSGGRLVFTSGLFLVDSPIIIPNNLPFILQGAGYGTGSIPSATVIRASAALSELIDANVTSAQRVFFQLRDLWLDGNDTTTIGVDIRQARRFEAMRNVLITNCTTGIRISYSWIVDFPEVFISGCTTGVDFWGGSTAEGMVLNAIRFLGGAIEDFTTGAWIRRRCSGIQLIGVTIETNENNARGVRISREYDTGSINPQGCLIKRCGFEFGGANPYHILIDNATVANTQSGPRMIDISENTFILLASQTIVRIEEGYQVRLHNNRLTTWGFTPTVYIAIAGASSISLENIVEGFIGDTNSLVITNSGTSTEIRHNDVVGYVTENQGGNEASNGDYIAHGLSGTPDHVFLNVEESDSAYSAQAYSYNSTHFRLYLYDVVAAGVENVDKTIEWYAIYEP